jgi:hypothetical protein
MSPIRAPVPSPLFPTQSPPPPVRASRSEFFRAALDRAGAPIGPYPVSPPESAIGALRAADERPQRPGALLDIRV